MNQFRGKIDIIILTFPIYEHAISFQLITFKMKISFPNFSVEAFPYIFLYSF